MRIFVSHSDMSKDLSRFREEVEVEKSAPLNSFEDLLAMNALTVSWDF